MPEAVTVGSSFSIRKLQRRAKPSPPNDQADTGDPANGKKTGRSRRAYGTQDLMKLTGTWIGETRQPLSTPKERPRQPSLPAQWPRALYEPSNQCRRLSAQNGQRKFFSFEILKQPPPRRRMIGCQPIYSGMTSAATCVGDVPANAPRYIPPFVTTNPKKVTTISRSLSRRCTPEFGILGSQSASPLLRQKRKNFSAEN
jgi:hypothetical protein